jgi:hypothetical protein
MANHYETRYQSDNAPGGSDYIAKLRDDGTTCTEIVFYRGEQIHRAEFPSSNLGTAKRGEYLDCMVISVARKHKRDVAVETTTKPAPVAAIVTAGSYQRVGLFGCKFVPAVPAIVTDSNDSGDSGDSASEELSV